MKVIFIALLLTGCASIKGLEITDDERKACAVQSCTAWTEEQLARVARHFYLDGYKTAQQSGAKSL